MYELTTYEIVAKKETWQLTERLQVLRTRLKHRELEKIDQQQFSRLEIQIKRGIKIQICNSRKRKRDSSLQSNHNGTRVNQLAAASSATNEEDTKQLRGYFISTSKQPTI